METLVREVAERILRKARPIENPAPEELREMARKDEITTEFGSPCYITRVRHRLARFTEVVEKGPDKRQAKILSDVEAYLKGKEIISLDRTIGKASHIRMKAKLLITKEYARIALMWNNLLFPPEQGRPDLLIVNLPEWGEREILVDPEGGVTFVLGTDYGGECKKAGLRMAMYRMKRMGGLGLHAGSKTIRIRDREGRLVKKGCLIFGLSGTGKTTLTVHDHGLSGEEGVSIRQDDVVLIDREGRCYGTENGLYIKTEGLDENQPVLYRAAISPHTILENVFVDDHGRVDFHDLSLTSNGRAVVRRKDVELCNGEEIDLLKTDVIFFITRRDDIIPAVCKLTTEQAAAFFMLGESVETSAGDPSRAGQSVHVVGDNPFIVGPLYEEGNRFLEILRSNPHTESYILNTGMVGEKDKITIEDTTTIMREVVRGGVEWRVDPDWGYLVPEGIDGIDSRKFVPALYYDGKEYKERVERLRTERRKWLNRFPELDEAILNAF